MQNGTGFPSNEGGPFEAASGVVRPDMGLVNAYLVGAPGGPWILVETGLPRSATLTRWLAAKRYGARPEAIILTHGHFDHAGSALDLSTEWDVPIYAHPLKMPYLTGKSDYPPQDPTMGGAIAQLARLFPHGGYDFGDRVRPLPADGSVPGPDGWRWSHTPGHTPGHVSLFREKDRVLLAGDSLATMDMDSWTSQLNRELHRPPATVHPRLGVGSPERRAPGSSGALSHRRRARPADDGVSGCGEATRLSRALLPTANGTLRRQTGARRR